MTPRDLLEENLEVDNEDVWENERTPTTVRCFAIRLHSMGLSVRIERSARLYRPEPHRKRVPDRDHADRPLSRVLTGQSLRRETVATAVQTPLQPTSTESSVRWLHPCRGGAELDSALHLVARRGDNADEIVGGHYRTDPGREPAIPYTDPAVFAAPPTGV